MPVALALPRRPLLPVKPLSKIRSMSSGGIPIDPKTLKILGAQAVGKEGVDKRIDVISTAMRLGATIRNLACLELCYAPPYSTVKDPVNILGTIAGNISEGVYKTIPWDEIEGIVADGGFLLDVMPPEELIPVF